MRGRRAQGHTLEAVMAGLVLLASVSFALQVTAVTPLTASTSSQHIQNQQGTVGEGALVSAAANGTIRPMLLYWNTTAEYDNHFWGATDDGYQSGPPPTPFGDLFERLFLDRGVVVNLNVYYLRSGGARSRERLLYLGEPSDNAVTATRTVTLYDDDELLDDSMNPTGTTLAEADQTGDYFAPDVSSGPVYNVVVVEVVAWRM